VVATRSTGRHPLPPPRVRESELQYVIELDVADFENAQLSVEALGPVVTVRCDEGAAPEEHSEESFRLPDDADLDRIHPQYRHGVLEVRVCRRPLVRRRLEIERRDSGLLCANAEAV
jgi:HSP20 family molecular chaperone IbpA